ncbi:hypothetical protein PHYPSEUDO_000256 [Phytophthora pseudosyringae]|uniref:Uncharacterized protein n=1 Tax=Phytophthora pseudosyringae TaxID=221518 RepID=A0A8T1VYG3_9STRA|nr:hypothetical protein PHYPSEUDO_000256 [Phytophthora pseudosyringae]
MGADETAVGTAYQSDDNQLCGADRTKMLRRWPQRGLAPATPAAQRAFWSQALELFSRLKGGGDASGADAVAAADAQDQARSSRRTANSAGRPRVPADAEFPTLMERAGASQVAHAKNIFSDFARHLRRTSDPVQLMQSWDVVRQCRPFVVGRDGLRLADNEASNDKAEVADVLLMLPADVFAQCTAGTNRRTMFANGNVTAANEAVVVALLVEYLYAARDHKRIIAFFEDYSRNRLHWLRERSAVESGADASAPGLRVLSTFGEDEEQKRLSWFVRATRLWAPARTAYLKSLLATNRYRKIVQFAREDARNLETACASVMTMSPVLIGCRKEKDSALARLAIETMSKKNPVAVLPLTFYELAFKAAMQKKNRDEGDLDNALWVARVMQDEAGYVLHPDLWFLLFNTSLHLKRVDCALEVFGLYCKNFTSLYQDHFRRALRKACRRNLPEVVLAMVRQWLAAFDNSASCVDAESKTKVLEFVLWEMTSSGHPVSALTEMLAIMGSSQIETGGAVLQRVVKTILDDATERLSPHEAVKNSLEFWKTHDSVVQSSVYLMYLLIQQCLTRGWIDECELVVHEIAERRFSRVPCNTVVKIMDVNEERGRFEDNVRMYEALLKLLPRSGLKSLNQAFFEGYMKALLCLGRFSEVREQHARLKLGKRYPKSAPLAVALRDAKAQQV